MGFRLGVTFLWIFFTVLSRAYSASIVFESYWNTNEPIFQGRINIVAEKDLTSGWQMRLTFNQPVTSLTLWNEEIVSQVSQQEYILKNLYQSHLLAGQTYTTSFHGRYDSDDARPDEGTAEWYGGSAGVTRSTSTTSAAATTTFAAAATTSAATTTISAAAATTSATTNTTSAATTTTSATTTSATATTTSAAATTTSAATTTTSAAATASAATTTTSAAATTTSATATTTSAAATTTAAASSTTAAATTTTSVVPTTTTPPVSACDGLMEIVRKRCDAYRGRVTIVFPEDVIGWQAVLQFTHPTRSVFTKNAIRRALNKQKTAYSLKSLETNSVRRKGARLVIRFKVSYNLQKLNGFSPCLMMTYNYAAATTTKTPTTSPTISSDSPSSSSTTTPAPSVAYTTSPTSTVTSTTSPTSTVISTTSPTSTVTSTTSPTNTTTGSTTTASYDQSYAQAVEYSFLFYEAQRSGALPADNRIAWRGDSSEDDGSDVGLDLSGGWHDAGDHVKFGLPMSAATTMLLHGLIYFEDAYKMIGQYEEGLRQIRWPLDYFMKCHQRTDRFYAQVGDGTIDHAHWGRPEEMDEQNITRPSYVVGAEAIARGGADVMGETAASLAAASILFKTSDAEYSGHLLSNATSLYQLAKSNTGTYNAAVPDGAEFYGSSAWEDEMAHAAAWLAQACVGTQQESTYRSEAESYLSDDSESEMWALDWSDKRGLVNSLLYHQTEDNRFKQNIESFLTRWISGSVPRTPLGLVFRLGWGSNRYAANSAFLALLAAKEGINEVEYRDYAKSQIDYMLGFIEDGRSYVVGFGDNPPKQSHHKAASCPLPTDNPVCDWTVYNDISVDNPNILYGALVGGPDANDGYVDERTDFRANEVSCDYNAGYTGALAGLLHFGESSSN